MVSVVSCYLCFIVVYFIRYYFQSKYLAFTAHTTFPFLRVMKNRPCESSICTRYIPQILLSHAGLHDPNLLKLRGFRQCQKDFKKQHIDDTLALGKAALEIKYMGRQKTKPSEERVDELCKKIRTFVIAIWTDLRNGFLWQDPFGWGSMLRKDFKVR